MITLVDTVTPSADKAYENGDTAFAGYVGGYYADLPTIERDYPHHRFVSIAVNDSEDAEFCDCEQGDLSPGQVTAWIMRMHERGVWRPGVYASASTLESVLPTLSHRLPRAQYRVWGADWNGRRDVPNGWDAHQYASNPDGRNVDLSVCLDSFFPRAKVGRKRTRNSPAAAHAFITYKDSKWTIETAK